MSDYRVKTNWGQSLVSLNVLNPQPRSEGVKATQRVVSLNGVVYDYGLYTELTWDFLEDPTEVLAIYTLFGIHSARSAPVTVYVPNDLYAYVRYNGRAVRPAPSWQNYFPRGVTILVKNLEVA